jgi:AcrR family transcriptional regulator
LISWFRKIAMVAPPVALVPAFGEKLLSNFFRTFNKPLWTHAHSPGRTLIYTQNTHSSRRYQLRFARVFSAADNQHGRGRITLQTVCLLGRIDLVPDGAVCSAWQSVVLVGTVFMLRIQFVRGDESQSREIAGEPTRAERILQAAGEIFIEKGFDAATTLDIASRARVSKRDLYRHFDSKQGILAALITSQSTQLALPSTLAEPRDLDHLLEILRAFGPVFLRSYLAPNKIALYRIAVTEAPRSSSLGKTIDAAGAGPVIASAFAFITKAVARGIVKPDDSQLVIQTFFDALRGPWLLRLLTGTHSPPGEAEIQVQTRDAVEVVRRLIIAAG